MIDESINKHKGSNMMNKQYAESWQQQRTAGNVDAEKAEQFRRTVVVGGFEEDSFKIDVQNKVSGIMKDVNGVEDIFAYRRGSIGFARFKSADAMHKSLQMYNNKDATKATHNGRTLWAAASRNPTDRRKGRIFSTYKRVLVEVGLADESQVDFDVKHGVLWVGRMRIGEWNGDAESGWLFLKSESMTQAGINVEHQMIDDAVREKLAAK